MADVELLRIIAARTGLGLKFLSKEDKLSRILAQLSDWSGLALVLKGGTALNRVFLGDVSRFSEDLDIDVIGRMSLQEKVGELKKRVSSLEGFDLKGPRMLHNTARFDAYYINEFGDKDRVMLEFYLSHQKAIAVQPIKSQLLHSRFVETSPAIFPCYSFEDLVARKFVALYRRNIGKDIYDLYHALALPIETSVLSKALKGLFKFYHIREDLKGFYQGLLAKKDVLMEEATLIGNSANHYIPRSLRPEWRVLISSLWERLAEVDLEGIER